ncbi:MAG TPA: Ig-like domain-containing protein [Cytophagaceae bacterium]|jgi:hypothetical protein|nr:Ig-like domain-containing protein [Cytophagaceae bacterium]
MQKLVKYFLAGTLFILSSVQAFAVEDSCTVAPVVIEEESLYSMALLDAMTQSDVEVSDPGDDGFSTLNTLSQSIVQKRDSVVATMNAFIAKGNFVNMFPDRIDKLPIGITKTLSNIKWTLLLTNLTVTPDGGLLSAYLKVEIQGKDQDPNKELYFGVEGVRLNGDGSVSDMKLVLLGEFAVKFNDQYRLVLTGTMNTNTGLSTPQSTYAVVGCQGLKLLNLNGYLELSNKLVIPVDPSQTNVKAAFAISATSFNDIVVQVTLPPFEVKGLSDVEFTLRNATLDLSDTRNAPSMVFPTGYQDKYYPGNSMLWRGVYIQELDIVLPQQFTNKNTGVRPSFVGQCMIFDQQGVSGIYSVNATLLSLGDGNASGWKFSVDRVTLQLEANKLTQGGFGGGLVLPVSNRDGSTVPMAYNAIITDQDEYILTATLTNKIGFDMLQADVELYPNSYITLGLIRDANGNKKFKPLAVLTGTMTISSLFRGTIGFTELRLMTDAPYFKIGGVSYTTQNTMSNYPVSISQIGIAETTIEGQDCLEFKFSVAVNIDEGKIKGNTTLSLSCYYDKPSDDETGGKWKFYKFRVYEIDLLADFSSLKVFGKIIFMQDDPIYGNGFYGQVNMTYSGKFTIMSEAIFGAKTFRYWYVYAQIDLPVPITVVGPFMLGGFGGGAYSKMSIAPRGSAIPYLPDSTSSFGVKAMVGYVVAKKEVCKGSLVFEMCFNSSGGVKYISFYGTAEILAGSQALASISSTVSQAPASATKATDPATSTKIASGNVQQVAQDMQVGSPPTSSIFASIGIQYNFETSTLEATSEIFINLGMLKGIGTYGRAGWLDFHMAPDNWHCYAGTPEDRLGIVLSIAGMQLKTGSYFMVGTQMPTFPDPPTEVMRILGPDLYPAQNNISTGSLQTGSGFAFGLDLSLHADIKFLILYANMTAGVGGDVMLRQYPDAHCAGSTAELGINNWYANGRVYTYLEGEIGVQVDLFFIHTRIPILNGAAAAMLEGGGPNPTWATGYLRVVFSVLGGKVSGDMKMKMSLGDECVIVNNTQAPVNFKIISDVTPVNSATEVDVFTSPQIAFNVSVDDPFEVSDGDNSRMFRVKISSLKLTSGSSDLTFTQNWTNKKQTLTLTPNNSLPSQTTVQLNVTVLFEVLQNGSWSTYVVNGNTPTEQQVISFKTSVAPTDIPMRNVAFMYPVHQQKNLYKDENKTGYIVLKQWQDYLLDGDTKTSKLVKLTSSDSTQQVVLTPVLSRGDKKISFDISALKNTTTYSVALVTRPIGGQTATADSSTASFGNQDDGQYNVTENKAQTVVKNSGEKLLLPYSFATSKYTTLSAKLNDINSGISARLTYMINPDYTNVRTRGYEAFDSTELFGSAYTANEPLLNYQSLLSDTYYQSVVFPKIYKDYPYSSAASITIKDRDVSEYGFPPAKAMYNDPEYVLDPNRMPYIDGLVDIYRRDYTDIENQMINQYVNGKQYLLKAYPQFFLRFPEPPANNIEQVQFNYVMPGNQMGTSAVINYKR